MGRIVFFLVIVTLRAAGPAISFERPAAEWNEARPIGNAGWAR